MTGHDDEGGRRDREDAEWQSIVENYGDHPEFTPPVIPEIEDAREPTPGDLPAEFGPEAWSLESDEDRYVPPPPPPVPRPHGLRLAAWLGLFGVPTIVLICIVLKISLPSPLGFLALVWFVAGFGYLVATMNGPKDPGEGWDDGAVI